MLALLMPAEVRSNLTMPILRYVVVLSAATTDPERDPKVVSQAMTVHRFSNVGSGSGRIKATLGEQELP
jgi:hypothetical protein